ncbi:uncharacterized protein PGTG_07807 [Puccinia graminis f. sp. tritici CRL 75-36-700-3]|uniref:Uncharacterized protein n=1 Tax=Puccinia graminis f. sp. tritici (strain CRL 75-36-700-3 / race SCCL) TaxID=418459 RepID=E3KB26_PUCGT|nr:uncharacterized protein PGTG_07807 [Puccinia graminis f. sp. tritici CRL 75-36-700-3]EFP81558.1 hypothetical protein PGTG_07807 [Puccinia graminis f. sp. tritici CRL 75-36-700-3]
MKFQKEKCVLMGPEGYIGDFFHMQYFNDNLGSTFSPHINSISNEKGKKRKYIWDHGEDWHHTFEVDPHGTFSSSTGSAFNQEEIELSVGRSGIELFKSQRLYFQFQLVKFD